MNNYRKVSLVLLIVLVSNLTIAGLKIFIGTLIKSEGITADGFQSLTDGSGNIIGLIGIKMASRPADINHPYGHKKYETLSSLFIAFLLLIVTFRIIAGAIHWFFQPVTPKVTNQSLIVIIVTLCVNIFISTFEYFNGKKYRSDILLSDSLNTRSDVFVSLGILLTLIGIRLGLPIIIDPIASLLIACVIIYAAVEIMKIATGVLADKKIIDSNKVKKIISEFPEIKNILSVRSRGRKDDIYVDLKLETNPFMNISEFHRLNHEIENRLRTEINPSIQLNIHLEPYKGKV